MKNKTIKTIERLIKMGSVSDKDIIELLLCTSKEIAIALKDITECIGVHGIIELTGCTEEQAEYYQSVVDNV